MNLPVRPIACALAPLMLMLMLVLMRVSCVSRRVAGLLLDEVLARKRCLKTVHGTVR